MSINGTLAFVILWIVNALIALVYLLVGIFLYVPACDLKREQGRRFSTTIGEHFYSFYRHGSLPGRRSGIFSVQLSDLQDGIPPGGRSGRCYFQQGTCADTSESGRGRSATWRRWKNRLPSVTSGICVC